MRQWNKNSEAYLFFAAYAAMASFAMLVHIPELAKVVSVVRIIGLILLIFIIFLKRDLYNLREIVLLILAGILGTLVAIRTQNFVIIKLVIFIAAIKGLEFNRLVRFDVFLRIFLISTVIILYLAGVAPDDIHGREGGLRHSLGFPNPNGLGMALMILSLEILYLNKMRCSVKCLAVVIPILLFSYYFNRSVSSNAIIIAALLVSVFQSFICTFLERRCFQIVATATPFVLTVILMLSACFYTSDSALLVYFNDLLTNRIYLIGQYVQDFDLSLFGNDLTSFGLALDPFYSYLIIGLGILTSLAFFVSFPFLINRLTKNNNYEAVFILFCFCVYGISERIWTYPEYNVFMLVYAVLFYRDFACVDKDPCRFNERMLAIP